MNSTQKDGVADWANLWQELSRRTVNPWKHAPFCIYVLVAVVGLGGLGIWVEAVKLGLSDRPESYDGIFTAVTTFYPALIGSASFQLLLIATENEDRTLTAFSVFVLVASLGSAILLSVFRNQYPPACLSFAILLAIISMLLWSIANADNPIYKSVAVDVPAGGRPDRALPGDISEFEAD